MFRGERLVGLVLIFLLGWFSNSLLSHAEMPGVISGGALGIAVPPERAGPADRVAEDQIKVYNDKISIEVHDPEWATFIDTNSMDPLLDVGVNALQIKSKDAAEIQVGDVVSYRSSYAEGIIIHRVIRKGTDDEGTYFIVKGDNNSAEDPGRIRFSQIERVLIGVIY